jgi:hypothetical protein
VDAVEGVVQLADTVLEGMAEAFETAIGDG